MFRSIEKIGLLSKLKVLKTINYQVSKKKCCKICFSEQVKLGYQENFTSLMEGFNLPKKFCYYQNEHYPLFYFVEPLDGYK